MNGVPSYPYNRQLCENGSAAYTPVHQIAQQPIVTDKQLRFPAASIDSRKRWWETLFSSFVQFMTAGPEVRVWTKITPEGLLWCAYDPEGDRKVSFTTEQDLREWLSIRHLS